MGNLGICGHLVTPLNTHQKSFEERSGSMKSIVMIFMFMGLLTPPPLDAFPQGIGCQCTGAVSYDGSGKVEYGGCAGKGHNGKYFCYVQKGPCCEESTGVFPALCINYSLCDNSNTGSNVGSGYRDYY